MREPTTVARARATRPEGRGSTRPSGPVDHGFTLVELLITMVILGILAGVVVFAVRGINGEAEESACAAELRILRTAQESHDVLAGGYGDETALVALGIVREPSELYDVTVGADGSYLIAPSSGSDCTQSATGPIAASAGPTTTPTTVTPTVIDFGGYPAWEYGASGADEVLVLGRAEGAADFVATITAAPATSRRVTFIDLDQLPSDVDIDAVMARSRTNGITDFALYADDDTRTLIDSGGGTWPSVHAYLSGVVGSDPYRLLDGDGGGTDLTSLLTALG